MRNIVAAFIAMLLLGVIRLANTESTLASEIASVKRTSLQKVEVLGSNYDVVFDLMDISPGRVPRHSHPGPTLVYVLERGFTFLLDGQPPRTFNAGDSFEEPAGVIHEGFGDKPTKAMVVFIVLRGQPLVTPVQ